MPAVQLERLPGLEPQAVIGPAPADVQPYLATPHVQPVAFRFGVVELTRHDGAVRRGWIDPRRKAEGIHVVEVRYITSVHVALPIKTPGLFYFSSNVREALVLRVCDRWLCADPSGRFRREVSVEGIVQRQSFLDGAIRGLRFAEPLLPPALRLFELRL